MRQEGSSRNEPSLPLASMHVHFQVSLIASSTKNVAADVTKSVADGTTGATKCVVEKSTRMASEVVAGTSKVMDGVRKRHGGVKKGRGRHQQGHAWDL